MCSATEPPILPPFDYDPRDAQRFVTVVTTREHARWLLERLPDFDGDTNLIGAVAMGDPQVREDYNAYGVLTGALRMETSAGETHVCLGMRHRTVALFVYDLRFELLPQVEDDSDEDVRRVPEHLPYENEMFRLRCKYIIACNTLDETERVDAAYAALAAVTVQVEETRRLIRDAVVMVGDPEGTAARALRAFDRYVMQGYLYARDVEAMHRRVHPQPTPDQIDRAVYGDDLEDLSF